MLTNDRHILALDVGDKRVGVALAGPIAKLAAPYGVLENGEAVWDELAALIKRESVGVVVVGLPRSLQGEETNQTRLARQFAAAIKDKMAIEVVMQDEALTSRQAEAELRRRGKQFSKGDIDALAAVYILEDYLRSIGTIGTMEQQI